MDTKYNRSHWERKQFGYQHSSKISSFVVIFIMFKKFLDISSAGFEIQQIYSQREGKRKIRVHLRPVVKGPLFKTTLYSQWHKDSFEKKCSFEFGTLEASGG